MSARLGRVHLRVTNLDRAIRFYTKVLGLRVSHRDKGAAFLAAGDGHHEVALHVHDPQAPPAPLWLGCRFVGFEVTSKHALVSLCERLGGARASIMVTGDSLSVHTTDPDGNGVEVYYLTPSPSSADPQEVRTLSFAELQAAAKTEALAAQV